MPQAGWSRVRDPMRGINVFNLLIPYGGVVGVAFERIVVLYFEGSFEELLCFDLDRAPTYGE
jgi:hypothetical protein